jgi:hypothetical protein
MNSQSIVDAASLRRRSAEIRSRIAVVETTIRRLLPSSSNSSSPNVTSQTSETSESNIPIFELEHADSACDDIPALERIVEADLKTLHQAESKLRGLELRLKNYANVARGAHIPEVTNHLRRLSGQDSGSPKSENTQSAAAFNAPSGRRMPRAASATSALSSMATSAAPPKSGFPFAAKSHDSHGSPRRSRPAFQPACLQTSSSSSPAATISVSSSPGLRSILKRPSVEPETDSAPGSPTRRLQFAELDEDGRDKKAVATWIVNLMSDKNQPASNTQYSPKSSPVLSSSPGLANSTLHFQHLQDCESLSGGTAQVSSHRPGSPRSTRIHAHPLSLPPPPHLSVASPISPESVVQTSKKPIRGYASADDVKKTPDQRHREQAVSRLLYTLEMFADKDVADESPQTNASNASSRTADACAIL